MRLWPLVDPQAHMVPSTTQCEKKSNELEKIVNSKVLHNNKMQKEKWYNLDSHYKNLSNNYKGIGHHTSYKEFTIDECDKFTIYFGNSTRNIMKQFEAFEGELFHSCPCTLKIYSPKGMIILFQMCRKLTMQNRNIIQSSQFHQCNLLGDNTILKD